MSKSQNTVRMRPPTYALFDELHQKLNSTLPFGGLTKAELLDICVNSTSAAYREGRLQIDPKRKGDQAA